MTDFYSSWGPANGTLAAVNDMVALLCPGSTSAFVSVNGTWTGDILIYGTTDPGASVKGTRIAYKSGIGSSGTATITGNGALVQKEFPVITGGQRLVVQAQANFVGSVAISILATVSASIIGISGPVHTAEEEAIRNAHGFSASTGIQTVPAGMFLNLAINNPSNSSLNMFIRRRFFFTNRSGADAPLQISQLENPVTTGMTFRTGSNLQLGAPASPNPLSVCMLAFNVSATHIDTSPPTSNPITALSAVGSPFVIDTERELKPGATLGYYITGTGSGANASKVDFVINWFEESIP
jgi:hypothetical protein